MKFAFTKALKCFLPLLLCCLSGFYVPAQDVKLYTSDSIRLYKVAFDSIKVKPEEISRYESKLPLQHIQVYDVRADTSFFCIVDRKEPILGGVKVRCKRMQVLHGLSASYTGFLESYFAQQLADSVNGSLLCFVKQFRIYGADTLYESRAAKEQFAQIGIEMECYYKLGNTCYPALRIDSIHPVMLSASRASVVITDVLTEVASLLAQKLHHVDFNRVVARKKYTMIELEERYAHPASQSLPLTLTSFKKGIYKTFEEWKANQPALPGDYSFLKDKKAITLFDAEKNAVAIHKIYGVSDGVHFWVQSMGQLYPLIRVRNSYEFYGFAISGSKLGAYIASDKLLVMPAAPDASATGIAGALASGLIMNSLINRDYNYVHGVDVENGMLY